MLIKNEVGQEICNFVTTVLKQIQGKLSSTVKAA